MTSHRRRLLAIFLGIGLASGLGLGIAIAVNVDAKPSQGPRDDGASVQTEITLSGDLLDGAATAPFRPAEAYWDTPNPGSPATAYEIPVSSGADDVADDGTFVFNVRVPLTDGSGAIVRPGGHTITVCAVRGGDQIGTICTSATFKALKGVVENSRNAARPGAIISTHGERFSPGANGESVKITLDGSLVELADPGSSKFDLSWTVPSLSPGTYKLVTCNVTGRNICLTAETVVTNFTVLSPKLKLNPTSGFSGDTFAVSGTGFYSNRVVGLFFGPVGSLWDDPGIDEIKPAVSKSSDADGSFGPFSYAPTNQPGEYWVIGCTAPPFSFVGTCDPGDTVHAVYTILAPSPSPTLSPTPTLSATPVASLSPTLSPTPSPTPSLAPTVAPVSAPPTVAPTAPPTAPPTSEPTPAPTPTAKPVTWPEHLRSPGQSASGGGLDLETLGGMSLLALLIAFLVPFPGTLFNKTVEANHAEIMGWIAGLKRRWSGLLDRVAIGPLGGARRWLGSQIHGLSGVLIFLALSALVYGFLSPTFGLDVNSLVLFLGLLVGLALIVAAFDLPLRIYHGRTSRARDKGVLRTLWWTLLVAVLCVIASRVANFQPGYLYGLIISTVFVAEITSRNEGIGTWLGAAWLLALSFLAWVALGFVRQGALDPLPSLFLQTVLVTFVVAGIETLVIGLLPMRFLPGHPMYRWRKSMWLPVFALAVMGYLLILVDPVNGYLSDDSRTPMLLGVIFLVTFGVVSLGTWAYFRFRPARPAADQPGAAPTA